mgnify:CR=1 FL=1
MITEGMFAEYFEKTDYEARENEILRGIKRGQKTYDVVIPWSHYHALNSSPAAKVFSDPSLANEYASLNGDKIVTTSLRNAAFLAATFDILCAHAWTANQSSAEATESRMICEIAHKFLNRALK